MNFLAHARLSFSDPEILVGNMISDFVKGKKKFDYPAGIQKGIELHRLIDQFTDEHPATRAAKEFFRPDYRLYSGAIADVVYDHFLATDPAEFNAESLSAFSTSVYLTLEAFQGQLPLPFLTMLPYMRQQNWLFNYSHRWGIQRSLNGVARRSAYMTEGETAFRLFEQHYQRLGECYRQCWYDMKPYAFEQFSRLLNAGL